mgnify:CR=1 FL=1
MGIRGNNNIRVVKKNVTNNDIVDNNSTLPFTMNDKIFYADTIIVDNNFVNKDKLLDADELEIFNQVWTAIKNNDKSCPHRLQNPMELFKEAYSFSSFLLKKNQVNKKQYYVADQGQLVAILADMDLVKKKGDLLKATDLTEKFVNIVNKMGMLYVPFEWEFMTDKKIKKAKDLTFLFNVKHQNLFVPIKIKNNDYVFLSQYKDSLSNSTFLLNSNLVNQTIPIPFKEEKVLKNLSKKEPQALNLIKTIVGDVNEPQIEMSPIAVNNNLTILQGNLDGQPIYINMGNTIMKYCHNVYGDNLRLTINYNKAKIKSSSAEYSEVFVNVLKDNSLVYSTAVNIEFPRTKKHMGPIDKFAFNTITANINNLKNSFMNGE